MNTQKIKGILRAIQHADALTVGESPLLHTGGWTSNPIGSPHSKVISIDWYRADRVHYQDHFQECALNEAEIHGNQITLRDEQGTDQTITLYTLTPFDIEKDMAPAYEGERGL